MYWFVKVLVAQSCLTLCDPVDPTGSSVHGILQARTLEWVASPFSRGLPNPGIKPGLPHCRQILYCLSHHNVTRTMGLKIRELVMSQFWRPEPEIKVSAGPYSPGDSRRGACPPLPAGWLFAFPVLRQYYSDVCFCIYITFLPRCVF